MDSGKAIVNNCNLTRLVQTIIEGVFQSFFVVFCGDGLIIISILIFFFTIIVVNMLMI